MSLQETAFLKKARVEAAVNRGYPLALISMGCTLLGVGRYFPKWARWQKWTLVGVVGKRNVMSTVSIYNLVTTLLNNFTTLFADH